MTSSLPLQGQAGPAEQLGFRQGLQRLAVFGGTRAVACLPERQREAVELLKLRELSLAEAARLTGSSEGALKVNVHRAIKALRARWGRG